ncbi:MAG: DUF1489 domain-containing protein [Gluconacetobacter diazotrophicus]|nr:DUF1489 domain-containing protein [Gluconacetobacter diazotrophicus]
MLHLLKLAVGANTPEVLARRQRDRAANGGPHGGQPFFRTRNFPRRAPEVLAGGSIFWVTGGLLLCRQRITGIVQDRREDGTPCTAVLLDGAPVPVAPRPIKAFQGWRYLEAAQAPADLPGLAGGGEDLPAELRRALAALCLL